MGASFPVPLTTRLTQRLQIAHPILLAPMGFAAGGRLAAAVTNAGALGIIGGGYGDAEWLDTQFREAGNAAVGCGFITWSMAQKPAVLDRALAHKPRAIMLSFGDPRPFASRIKEAGALLICQIQTRADAEIAIDAAADIIVAQGAEAGGHGEKRATLTLVPEVADMLAARAPETLLCAAGGIADGRGLAAALMLGADGVVVGTRLWASNEALIHDNLKQAALSASGDDTVRQTVTDIVRGFDWPERFNIRVMRNAYVDRWLGQEPQLRSVADIEKLRYVRASDEGDATTVAPIVGEGIGLIRSIEPAQAIIGRMVLQAEVALRRGARAVLIEED
jgi:nitronate monooxygenase